MRRIPLRTAVLWGAWLISCATAAYGAVTGDVSLTLVAAACGVASGVVLAFWLRR